MENATLRHNAAEQRYELPLDGGAIAVVDYIPCEGYLILTHVGVSPKFEGQGVASRLVAAVLDDIRHRELRIVAQCPFVERYIERHPEWRGICINS